MDTKQNSNISALLQVSSTEGVLDISVPRDYIVSTVAIHVSAMVFTPGSLAMSLLIDTFAQILISSVMPVIHKKLVQALDKIGFSGKNQQNVIFIPALAPMEVSGYVMGGEYVFRSDGDLCEWSACRHRWCTHCSAAGRLIVVQRLE